MRRFIRLFLRLIAIFIIGLTLVIAALFGWLYIRSMYPNGFSGPGYEFDSRLNDAIRTQHQTHMQDLTPFKWEIACFVGPYSTVRDGILINEYKLAPIQTIEDSLLVFGLPDKTTVVFNIKWDFYDPNKHHGCLTYDEARNTFLIPPNPIPH